MNMNTKVIAVVGSGLIGQGWALVFGRAGFSVQMWDESSTAMSKALETMRHLATELQSCGLISDIDALFSRIKSCESLEAVLQGAQYVQECLPETLEIKQSIFRKMDVIVPRRVVLASSTSSIPSSAFTEQLAGRDRCLVAHPVNPPYLIPVVEISGSPWTSADAIESTVQIMHLIKQKPVVVKREIEGFILNRLQGAVLREAFRLVEQGYVDAEGLDTTLRDGLGLRWSFMGPFETIDLNAPDGLSDYCARYGELYRRISEEQTSTAPWSQALIDLLHQDRRTQVPQEEMASRRIWRDRRLMALAVHKKEMVDKGIV
ncbi:MAG: 3-hydroxyacyl-CoA dehydrogenase [Betaproteobacteria bacterium]|jgi:L-gulonate 3-dehydrogenase